MIELITDKNGVTWICFVSGETVKPQPKPRTRKKPVRRYSDFEFRIRFADSAEQMGNGDADTLYFEITDVDGFVAAFAEALKDHTDVDCEVAYYDREYGVEYCQMWQTLPYKREQKLMQQAVDKLNALGLPLTQYSE